MAEAQAAQAPETKILIPVTKAKQDIEVDLERLPIEVYREALYQGLKVLANRNQTKITVAKLEGEQLAAAQAASMTAAEKSLKDMYEGTIRLTGKAKAKKASGAVMTEARRLARALVKAEMKEAGIKVSHVDSKEITRAANEVLADGDMGPKLITQAEANIKAREEEAAQLAAGISKVAKTIKVNPALVAKAEKEKAAKKAATSAKQAGKVVPQKAKGQKPGAQQTAH